MLSNRFTIYIKKCENDIMHIMCGMKWICMSQSCGSYVAHAFCYWICMHRISLYYIENPFWDSITVTWQQHGRIIIFDLFIHQFNQKTREWVFIHISLVTHEYACVLAYLLFFKFDLPVICFYYWDRIRILQNLNLTFWMELIN